MANSCFGGVSSSLGSSATNFLAAGTGLSQQGRPAFSFNMVVPSFVSTFANPSMSASVSSPSVSSLQNDATRDVADRSAVLLSPLLDQPFIVGPGFSPVPAKLVAQIVAGKYIDLSDLLAVNLVQREPEPQLLFDGRLVLTSQPKKQQRRIEDIASWMEAFAIFSLILVSQFPNRWKDLMQYQSCSTSCWSWGPTAIFPAEFGLRMIKPSVSTRPLCGSPTGLLWTFNCSTFIQPVRQPVALRWSPRMTRLSHQVPPRRLFIANPGKRGVVRLCSPPASTLTGAVCAQVFTGQSPALTSQSKRAVMSPNVVAILQVPQGRPFGLRPTVVDPFSSFLPCTRGRSSCLISVIVIRLTYLVLCELWWLYFDGYVDCCEQLHMSAFSSGVLIYNLFIVRLLSHRQFNLYSFSSPSVTRW